MNANLAQKKASLKQIITGITLFLLCLNTVAFARDIRFEVTVDRNKISIDSTANLKLTFYGTQDISAPDLPDIHGFDWRYIGPSLKMSIVNGRTSTSITHNYVLIPLKVGKFTIPPLSVYYNGKTYNSDPIPIEVVSTPVSPPPVAPKKSVSKMPQDLEDRIFLTMEVGKRRAYVNEIIPVTIKLYINNLAIKGIHYPEFDHKGFSADKFDEHRQYREILQGVPYDVVEFNTYVFGTRPGEFVLGPAFLECDLLIKRKLRRWHSSFFNDDDFFGPSALDAFFGGGYEKYPLNLKSADIPVTIMELPRENMPADFTGAVGDYRFYIEANPKDVKVGDPITLKMTITGEGNFNTVKVPSFNADNNFKIYDPDVKQDQTGKVFEQVIIPKNDKIKAIPPITFSFFDTTSGQYRKIVRGPIPIKVRPLPKGESLKIFETPHGATKAVREREILGRDIIYIKENPGLFKKRDSFLCKNKFFIAIQFVPFLAVIFTLVVQRRKERLEKDISYARRLRAPRKARKNLLRVKGLIASKEPTRFFDAVFKTLQEYLGDKFHLPTAGITSSVVETLENYNIDKEILDSLRECFKNCDMARYAQSTVTKEDMANTLKLLEEVIDKLERVKL